MKNYLDILDNTLSNGRWKEGENGKVLSFFGESFRHDMCNGFPLVTTNETPIDLAWAGLEGLINGVTSEKLGPIDGYQWRKFNQPWQDDSSGDLYTGIDQLQRIVDTLSTDPENPTLLCTSWNPAQLEKMELKPYRILWNVVASEGKLHLAWYQRSAELVRGLPINIAMYATLLLLLAEGANLSPGTLHGTFADCYLREAHLDDAEIQIKRIPRELPLVVTGLRHTIFNWSRKDAALHNYNPHPRLNFRPILL